MSRAAHAISAGGASFYSPRVLAADSASGTAEFEWIPNAPPISRLIAGGCEPDALFRRVAQALCDIHDGLHADERRTSNRLERIASESPRGFIHGDFTIDNVLRRDATGGIVVVDWSLAPWLDEAANYGPLLWDVTWMVQSILMLHPFRIPTARRFRAAHGFVSHYVAHNAHGVSGVAVAQFAREVADLTEALIDEKLRLTRPLMKIGINRMRRFYRVLEA